MKRSRFAEKQNVQISKEAGAGAKTAGAARRDGVPKTPLYSRKANYDGFKTVLLRWRYRHLQFTSST